jgi:hypothetical protein
MVWSGWLNVADNELSHPCKWCLIAKSDAFLYRNVEAKCAAPQAAKCRKGEADKLKGKL